MRLACARSSTAIEDPDGARGAFEKHGRRGVRERARRSTRRRCFEIDDVIDPAETRRWITSSFPAPPAARRPGRVRPVRRHLVRSVGAPPADAWRARECVTIGEWPMNS